jgi:hypothetical protein
MSPLHARHGRPLALALATAIAVIGAETAPRALGAQGTQHGAVVHVKAAKGRGAGADANVKADTLPGNQTGKTVPAPPSKGGAKTRGAMSGTLHVDNRTPWIIRIYVDGDYVGNVSRYGDSYGYYGCSVRTLYARALFTDGSSLSWGPSRRDLCDDATWELDPS